MISKRNRMITAAVDTFFSLIFVLGRAESNTAGFAGFRLGFHT
jgi:hypothetical protein